MTNMMMMIMIIIMEVKVKVETNAVQRWTPSNRNVF